MPRLETVYRQMREAADAGTDLTEGLEELNEVHGRRADKVAGGEKAPMKIKTKDALKGNKEGEDLGKAVVSPDEKDSGPSKSADKMKGGLTPAGKRRGDKKQGEVKGDYIKKIGINAGDHEDEDAISEDELEELDDLLDEIKDDDEDDDDEMKDDEDDEYDDEDKKKMKKEKFDFSKLKKNGDKDKDEDSDEDDEDHDEDDEDDDKDKKEAVLTKNDMIEAIKSKMIGMRKGKVSAAYESFLIQLEELDADISVEESARRFADSVEVDVTQDAEALLSVNFLVLHFCQKVQR